MSKNNDHDNMELMPQRGAQEAFLDAEPLVDVDSLSYQQQQTYQRQEVFLEAYVQYGTLLKAAEIANCHYDCAYQWRPVKFSSFCHLATVIVSPAGPTTP